MYSFYNVYLREFPQGGFTTIYNLLTNELACFASKNLFPEPNKLITEKLVEKGIWLSKFSNEHDFAIKRFKETVFSKEELVLVLLLTSKCNCKCVYCYENEVNLNFTDFCEYDKTLEFINKKMREDNIKNLRIVYYGGEPLLNKKVINKLSSELRDRYKENYMFSIVTNGTLLNENDVNEWIKLGLAKVKITLDGNSNSHDKRRPYRDGQKTYDDIVNNISHISEQVKIVINIIIDETLSGVEEMIKDLTNKGIKATYSLSFKEPEISDIEIKKDLLIQFSKILKDQEVNYLTNLRTRHGIICPGKRVNYYVIDGIGNIYNCESYLKHCIGNLRTEEKNDYIYKIKDKCNKCKYLPICYGECMYESACQKEYFDILLPELLKLYIQS